MCADQAPSAPINLGESILGDTSCRVRAQKRFGFGAMTLLPTARSRSGRLSLFTPFSRYSKSLRNSIERLRYCSSTPVSGDITILLQKTRKNFSKQIDGIVGVTLTSIYMALMCTLAVRNEFIGCTVIANDFTRSTVFGR
jgi:hypothetical protein